MNWLPLQTHVTLPHLTFSTPALSCKPINIVNANAIQIFLYYYYYYYYYSVSVCVFRVADNSEVNQMTASNLALIFGPTLMKLNRLNVYCITRCLDKKAPFFFCMSQSNYIKFTQALNQV